MVLSIISPNQKGFVPKCLIFENTHLSQLIEATLNETDETGLVIFCDLEKAFDRCSWDYIVQASKELGFKGYIQNWFEMLYNHYNPPRRKLKINGKTGPSFKLHSGVPQGDPLSPVIFLFVTEAFTRLVENPQAASEREMKGIAIGGITHKISQFTDDWLAGMLRGI